MRRELITAAGGLAGGAVGTTFMQLGMRAASRLPAGLQPPPPRQDPGDFMVSRAERLAGRELPGGVHAALAQALHWGYGISWPLALGAAAPRLALRTPGRAVLAGAALGAAVWAVGYLGWLPAAGLARPIMRERPGRTATNLAAHIFYGVAAALPIYLAAKLTD